MTMHVDPAWWDEIKHDHGPNCCEHHLAAWRAMVAVLRRERMRAEYPDESEQWDREVAEATARIGELEGEVRSLRAVLTAGIRVGPVDATAPAEVAP